MSQTIAVYGMGKLGLPLTLVLAESGWADVGKPGFNVVGVDPLWTDESLSILQYEPQLTKDWDQYGVMVSAEPVPSDVSFIVVPTPSIADGSFTDIYVRTALGQIDLINDGEERHTAVVVSTVSPGTMDKIVADFPGLDIVYNPTFIALGNVVNGLVRPDLMLLAGPANPMAKVLDIWRAVLKHWQHVHDAGSHIHITHSYTEVELLKLSVNAVLGTKISLANSLGNLFEVYGVDPAAVSVMGYDKRIGQGYLEPGSPITGPCLPRDNTALQVAAEAKEIDLPISVATDEIQAAFYAGLLQKILHVDATTLKLEELPKTIGILGMTYKYGIPVDTEAVGGWVQTMLERSGYTVHTYDKLLGGDFSQMAHCDVVVVTQKEYRYQPVKGQRVVRLWS